MQRIMFGENEMKPMMTTQLTSAVHDAEIDSQQNTNENQEYIQSTTNIICETVMPEADEPEADLEQSPILSELKSERKVINVKILGINKRQLSERSSPRFMFICELKWSDNQMTLISRDHDDFFRYHCWLLDTFKTEAGESENQPRIIPRLPGKKWFKNDLELAETRMPLIQAYLNDLIKIEKIGESYQAQAFFSARPGDPSKDDDNFKIILLKCAEKHLNEGNIEGSHDNMTFIHDEDEHEIQESNMETASTFDVLDMEQTSL